MERLQLEVPGRRVLPGSRNRHERGLPELLRRQHLRPHEQPRLGLVVGMLAELSLSARNQLGRPGRADIQTWTPGGTGGGEVRSVGVGRKVGNYRNAAARPQPVAGVSQLTDRRATAIHDYL